MGENYVNVRFAADCNREENDVSLFFPLIWHLPFFRREITEIYSRILRAILSYTCEHFFVKYFVCMMASNESLPPRVKESHRVRFLWPVAHSSCLYLRLLLCRRKCARSLASLLWRMHSDACRIYINCSWPVSYEIRNHGRVRNVVNYTDNVFLYDPHCPLQSIIGALFLLRKRWFKLNYYYVKKNIYI